MNAKSILFLSLILITTGIQAQRIKGSDTVLPVAQQTAERFMNRNADSRVTVTGGGTGVGISALMDNTTDIAMASRPIKFSEKMKARAAQKNIEEVIVAYDALAVVVHPTNPVKQLTRQQLEDIFRGKSLTGNKWVAKTVRSLYTPGKPLQEPTNSSKKVYLKIRIICPVVSLCLPPVLSYNR